MSSTKEKVLSGIQKIRDRFKDEVEEYAEANAIYSPEEYKEVDVKSFLANYELEKIGEGLNYRVFKIKGKKWIVKEAKWDMSMKFFGDAKVPLPARFAQSIMSLFAFEFLPKKSNILNDYRSYLEFVQYFGYFEKRSDYPHPSIDLLTVAQQNIRDTLIFFKSAIERKYKMKLNKKLERLLNSPVKYHNFLPREYQLIGESISKENQGKVTSFIFQEFVEGDLLADVPESKLSRTHKQQLVLMIYLIFLMHMQVGLIPDTKPRKFMINAYNWLTKTDNVIVTKKGIIFVDTRWFWDTNANVIKRGLVIPNLVINRAKFSLETLLKDV